MKDLSNLARHKRFKVKSEFSLTLVVSTDTTDLLRINISDCSVSGIFGSVIEDKSKFLDDERNQMIGNIFPNAKFVFGEKQLPVGRCVLKRFAKKEATIHMALSTIDTRIPVDSFLSHLLEADFESTTNELDMEFSEQGFTLADFLTADFNNQDILNRTEKFELFYKNYKDSNRYAYYYERKSSTGSRIRVKKSGANKNQDELLMFGSNDYLGLSNHPEVIEACNKANIKYGIGSSGTAPTSGMTDLHQKLCTKVASLHGTEEALVFPSGYAANIGIISGLARPGDLLVADIISHASIQDGMRMSGATNRFFKHNNMKHLEKVLDRERSKHSGCLILTEGLFSMDGTIGKIDEIIQIARKYNARVMADQGHCFGILGDTFVGTSEHLGVKNDLDITMGLFSKGVGGLGGFVTGPAPLMHWYKAYARSLMFATSFPPGIAAANLKSLEIIEKGHLQEKLRQNIDRFIKGLIKIGVPANPNHFTPIVPIKVGDESKMGKIFEKLLDGGIFALPVMYPVVSKNQSRFRFSITASFTESDIDLALFVLRQALTDVGFDFFNESYEKLVG